MGMSRLLPLLAIAVLVAQVTTMAQAVPAATTPPRARAAITASQQIAADSYVSLARGALAHTLSGQEGDVEIAPVGAYREMRVPAGGLEMVARPARNALRSRAIIWVDVFVDGHLRASRPVTFALHCWLPALVAKERLAAKTVPDVQRFEMRTADVAALSGTPVRDTNLLVGKRLRREVRADAVMSVEDLEDLPPVQRGGRIAIYARVGRIVVKSAAIAERDGFAGDVISARLPATGERVKVRVTGDNTAWISEHENRTL